MNSQGKQGLEQTRFIEDFRDKHKSEEIWILGCGPSLDDFPDDFFDDKITIALNWTIVAFPKCTYWHGHHEVFREYLRDKKPEFLEKSIILFPFPGPFSHERITQPKDFFGNLTSRPIWMKFWDTRPIPKSAFEDVVKYIVEKQTPARGYRASISVAHTAVEAAAVMGARRITMIGCEHRGSHAQRRELKTFHGGRIFPGSDPRITAGTRWLAELFGKHGIEVIRYYYKDTKHYKKGYEKIDAKKENMPMRITKTRKFRFHLLGLAHLPVSETYMGCAFTQKIVKLSKMLLSLGHEVILYGAEGSDAPRTEFVRTHSLSDIRREWGEGDNRFAIGYDWKRKNFKHDFNSGATKTRRKFFASCIREINARKKSDDFLLLTQGSYHKPIAEAVKLFLTCEPGVGYRGAYCRFKAFESSFLQNFTYGSGHPYQCINGNNYDRVIPNYFDPKDFEFREKKDDYFLYIGRLIIRKGIIIAHLTTKEIGAKLKIAGQGMQFWDGRRLKGVDFEISGDNLDFAGYVDPEERKKLFSHAKGTFVPTLYLEPFGGVSIESLLSGTPVITADFGVFPETIPHGVVGYRCNTLDDYVWAAKNINRISSKDCRDYAMNNFSMDRVKYMYQRWFEDLYAVYESAVDSSKKGWHRIYSSNERHHECYRRFYPASAAKKIGVARS